MVEVEDDSEGTSAEWPSLLVGLTTHPQVERSPKYLSGLCASCLDRSRGRAPKCQSSPPSLDDKEPPLRVSRQRPESYFKPLGPHLDLPHTGQSGLALCIADAWVKASLDLWREIRYHNPLLRLRGGRLRVPWSRGFAAPQRVAVPCEWRSMREKRTILPRRCLVSLRPA